MRLGIRLPVLERLPDNPEGATLYLGTGPEIFTMSRSNTLKAIFTDIQFWIPAVVLALGIALLVVLH